VIASSKDVDSPLLSTTPTEILVQGDTGYAIFDNLVLAGKPGDHHIHFTANVGSSGGGITVTADLLLKISRCSNGQELGVLDAGGYQCLDCDAGQFGDGNICFSCPPGTYAPKGAFNCTKCLLGTVQRKDDQTLCFLCERTTYSLEPGSKIDGKNFRESPPTATCKTCKKGAECTSGLIVARNGWWRPEPKKNDSFYKCKVNNACLGASNPNLRDSGDMFDGELLSETSFNESCADGYSGRLCHRCNAGWSRDGFDQCAKCFASGDGATMIALLGIITIFIIFGCFIHFSMQTKMNDQMNVPIILKIAASHLQTMALAAGLPFKWPPSTVSMFRVFDAMSSLSEDVINLECMYEDEAFRTEDNSVVYQTTFWILLGPFIFVIVAIIFWSIAHFWDLRNYRQRLRGIKRKNTKRESMMASERAGGGEVKVTDKQKKDRERTDSKNRRRTRPIWKRTRRKMIVSIIVVMVLVHPTLTKRSIQLLGCDHLSENDDRLFFRRDLQITCWEGNHFVMAMTVGIPFLILYAGGIPLVSIYVLYRRKHKLHRDIDTVSRFGFLYLGCKLIFLWTLLLLLLIMRLTHFPSQCRFQTSMVLGSRYYASKSVYGFH
jgi:hypothetical protein